MNRVLIRITGAVVVILIVGSVLLYPSNRKTKSALIVIPSKVVMQDTPTVMPPTRMIVSPMVSSTTSKTNDQLSQFVNPSLLIAWQKEKTSEKSYDMPDYTVKTISGKELDGEITYKNPSLHELSNTAYLQANGWMEDIQIAADGPNGSEWGFNKTVNGKKQVVIFSYIHTSFSPPPAQITCPCKFSVLVFLSDPF